MSQSLLSLKYTRGSLEVIDQLLLPDTLVFLPIKDCNDAWAVIRSMQVRGAPLIAIVAMLALAVEAQNLIIASGKEAKFDDLCVYFLERLEVSCSFSFATLVKILDTGALINHVSNLFSLSVSIVSSYPVSSFFKTNRSESFHCSR